jgi:RHS repeat-associated protein
MRSFTSNSLCICFFVLIAVLVSVGQGYDPSYQYGVVPFQTNIKGSEQINLATGNLHFEMPLVSFTGRDGHNFVYSMSYNSQIWWGNTFVDGAGNTHNYWANNVPWTNSFPLLRFDTNVPPPGYSNGQYTCSGNYRVQLPDGRNLAFPVYSNCINAQNGMAASQRNQLIGTSIPDPSAARGGGCGADFAYLTLTPTPHVVLENGENIWFDTGGSPVRDEDANGNTITFQPVNSIVTPTDTVGRTITFGGNGTNSGTITYTDSNGKSQTITISSSPITVNPHFHWTGVSDPGSAIWNLTTSIVYANGDRYDFQYNTYGEITKIIYPTGGYTRYEYNYYITNPVGRDLREVVAKHECRDFNARSQLDGNGRPGQCVSVPEDNTLISPTAYWNSPPGNSGTQVTSPVGDVGKINFQSLNSGGFLETERKIYSGSTTLLRTVATVNSCTGPTQKTVTYDDGSIEQTQWDRLDPTPQQWYQTSGSAYNTNVTAEREGPVVNGNFTPLRQIITNWLHVNPINNQDYSSLGIHIFTRKASEITEDSTGAAVAQTNYEYDNYTTPMAASGAIQQDAAYTTGASPQITTRGNLTAAKHWLDQSNSYLVTSNTYDDAGNVLSTTDPKTNTTMFSYADNFTDGVNHNAIAYITQTTLPKTGSTNHIEKKQYFYSTGLPAASCGQNFTGACTNNLTLPQPDYVTFTYERVGRPRVTTHGDGGQTSLCYSDDPDGPCASTSAQISESASQQLNTTSTEVHTTLADGLGNAIQTQFTSDPDGVTYVDTTYDAEGRKIAVSNPYRITSSGTTYYQFDALNRVTQMAPPDGTQPPLPWNGSNTCLKGNVCTVYSGHNTTVTDEAGNARTTQTDALGRMVSVLEDPGSSPHLNYQTLYAYNLLNNLTGVTQNGNNSSNARIRSFTYDSVSRLVCAANPEIHNVTSPCPASATLSFPTSGATIYTYDFDGNLRTKTAPSPNQPAAGTKTVTTTYTYDQLNRLTGKSYSDSYSSNPATASVVYVYDGGTPSCPAPIGFSDPNGIGRRTAMCDAVGSASWLRDVMGRITTENDRYLNPVAPFNSNVVVTINGVTMTSTNTDYSYLLNGDLFETFYPGAIPNGQFYTGETAAGRIGKAGDDYFHMLENATYSPDGHLAGGLVARLAGTYNGSTISNTYNNRLQPQTLLVTNATGGTILSLTYDFHLGTDNGNVYQIANGKDGNRTQNFTYDALNRIQQASTTGATWGEKYGIDPWGNLYSISGATGKNMSESLSCSPNNQNRLGNCFTYDSAGNIIKNGNTSYYYDAENRLIAAVNGTGYSYTYNGDGQRIEKCTMGATSGSCSSTATGTFYWHTLDGGGTLAESDLGGNWKAAYGIIRGSIVSRVDLPANAAHYYFHDELGSTNVIADATSKIVSESDYYPYGGEIPVVTGDPNTYKFTGKERDTETGLDMFGARYYGSSLGRFMTPDWAAKPISVPYANFGNPQSLNLYSYVENNPETLVDTDGHEISYADNLRNAQVVKDTVKAMLNDPHTSGNLSGYVGKDNPNLIIKSGDLSGSDTRTVNPDGSVTTTTILGDTRPDIQTTSGSSTDINGVTTASPTETTLTDATITIDYRVGKEDVEGVMVHEGVHAGEAKADPAKFSKDYEAEKSNPNHDARPQEQRANAAQKAYANEIKKAVKQIEKDRKKESH